MIKNFLQNSRGMTITKGKIKLHEESTIDSLYNLDPMCRNTL